MKYNDTVQILRNVAKSIEDPMFVVNKLKNNETLRFSNNFGLDNSMDNSVDDNIYAEYENSNKEYNESVSMEDSKSYNNSENNSCDNKQQRDVSSGSQGLMDSITQEITSVRLQQAIILSEIVSKPRCKTRKRRRF